VKFQGDAFEEFGGVFIGTCHLSISPKNEKIKKCE
jgi:hypothetical protein